MTTAKLGALIPRGRFGRAVSLVAGGTLASQLLGIALLPVLSRLYDPEAFGVLASYAALVATLQTVAALRYELAIPLAPNDREAALVLMVALGSVAGWTLLVLFGVAATTIDLVPIVGGAMLGRAIWLLPLGVALAGTYQSLRYWAIREAAYGDIAATTVSQGIARGVGQTAGGLLGFGALGLISGEIAGQGAGMVRLLRLAAAKVRHLRGELAFNDALAAARRNAGFPLMMAPASFINGAGMQIPTLMLAGLYGTDVAGWYFVTQRLCAVPVRLVSGSFGQVFLGEAATLARDDPDELGRTFRSLSGRLLLAGSIPTLVAMAFGPWAIGQMLGAEWAPAGVYLRWLAVSFLLKFSLDGLINLAIVQRNDYALAWATIRFGLSCGTVFVAAQAGLAATTCVALLGVGLAAGYLLKWWFWRRAIHQLQAATP